MAFEKYKLMLGIKKIGKRLLDDTNDLFEGFEDYLDKLKEDEQVICSYLLIVKLLSGFDEKTRNKIMERIKTTEWEKI